MSDDGGDGWRYAEPGTLLAALQRGLGRGAHDVMDDPAAGELVEACLRCDSRWDWQVDERSVYLARLVRDLRMPVTSLTDGLFTPPPESGSPDHQFEVLLEVLLLLGTAGVDGAVAGVRDYVGRGERWVRALEAVADNWPVEWWDDLYATGVDRLDGPAARGVWWRGVWWQGLPWQRWAARDRRIATSIEAAARRSGPVPPDPFADRSTEDLLDLLGRPERVADWSPVLFELRRRPPDARLLDLLARVLTVKPDAPVGGAVLRLGALALPAARQWVRTPEHPLAWTGWQLLADHGDTSDVPALLAGWDWLDSRPDDLCGYHMLAGGLARIGGAQAATVLPRLRRMWFSPHSYERPAYLRALIAFNYERVDQLLVEGLWDCESEVRLLAVQHAPQTEMVNGRVAYLRDDPIESTEVRVAAATRLGGTT